jgi:2-oxo-3-hexenedioate decarboxylase
MSGVGLASAGAATSVPTVDVVDASTDVLAAAVRERTAVPRLTEAHPDLSLDDAYRIQAAGCARRVAAGERVIGAKLGLTARAKQQQMNVAEPVYGRLLSGGVQPAGDPIVVAELIHPRIEPEIVFVLRDGLRGPGVTAAEVLAATRGVCCGLEIIDSRYADFSFTAADVVADNTSAARIVLGPTLVHPAGLDLALVGLLLEVDGSVVATAAGAATMGHPAEAVAMLANWLGARGEAILPGWIVFSGGLTAAVPLEAGTTVTATFGHLGTVSTRGV